jgi:hypothetical protein
VVSKMGLAGLDDLLPWAYAAQVRSAPRNGIALAAA